MITLGVIGIVAAMTLPPVVNKYRAKVLETGFKKSYSNLQNAYMMTKANLGVTNLVKAYATVLNNEGVLPFKDELENEIYPTFAGYPCSASSNQELNGIGCSWYAINDINPDDETKSYWDNLPK